jgi:GNAT superfamily N-acetyltransferase
MTDNLTITLLEKPDPVDAKFVQDRLREYNISKVGDDDHHQTLGIFLRDPEGNIMGGLLGDTYWGWLYVSTLWIDDRLRGQGYGENLLASAEQEAVRRGCHHAHLETMSFQALPFYAKHGYIVFGVLDDLPAGHKKYYLQKKLG